MSLLLREFEKIVSSIAPIRYLMKGDFYGWLSEKPKYLIKKICVAVDMPLSTPDCDILILHHKPAVPTLVPTFILHTPLDRCDDGCHERLLKYFGFNIFNYLPDRMGVWTEAILSCDVLLEKATKLFPQISIRYRFFKDKVKKISFFSGCGLNYLPFLELSAEQEIDLIISGDLTHKTALYLASKKIGFIDITHYFSEIPGVKGLVEKLSPFAEVEFIDAGAPFYESGHS